MSLVKIAKISAGVTLLVIAAGYGALSSIDVESYRDDIIAAAEKATGRKVTISGPIKLKVSLTPAVVLEGLTLSNAPWAKAPQMVKVGRAEAEVGLLSAIFGSIEVNRLVVHDTVIALQRQKDGTANWELKSSTAETPKASGKAEAPAAAASDGSAPTIAIRAVDIKNLSLSLNDAASGQDVSLDIKALTATANSFSDPVRLDLDMVYNSLPITASGTLGPVQKLTADQETQVDMAVKVPGVSVSAKGKIAHPLTAKGVDLALGLDGSSYDAIARAFAVDLAAVPPMRLSSRLETFGEQGYRLRDGVLTLAGQDISLTVSADLASRQPVIKAAIAAAKLDVPALLATQGKAPAGESTSQPLAASKSTAGSGRVFPADPLPLEGLRLVTLDASLDVADLTVPSGVHLKPAKIKATLNDGALQVKPDLGLGSGQLSGVVALTVPPSGNRAALSLDLTGSKIALADVAADAGVSDLMTGGATSLTVAMRSQGSSVRDLMAGLNGQMLVDTGKSEIINAKLAKLIGSWGMSGLTMIDPGFSEREKTVMSCMVARVPVKQGLATIDNSVAMETDVMNVVVDGDVNLKTEGLNLGLDTQAHGVGTGIAQSASGLVRVGGTLAAPTVGVSAAGAGKAALRVGAAIATGGLSLLGDAVLNQATKDSTPCLTAKGQSSGSAQGTSGSSSTSNTTSTSSKTSVNPVNVLGGAMKGLFGN